MIYDPDEYAFLLAGIDTEEDPGNRQAMRNEMVLYYLWHDSLEMAIDMVKEMETFAAGRILVSTYSGKKIEFVSL